MSEIIEGIKQAAADVFASMNPTDAMFGTVVSTAPLQINVEQRMVLGAAQLILTRNVTDYVIDMTMNHTTESALGSELHTHALDIPDTVLEGKTADEEDHEHVVEVQFSMSGETRPAQMDLSHEHSYAGRKTFTVHNGLAAGERVILLRVQEGQKFIVWDRVG